VPTVRGLRPADPQRVQLRRGRVRQIRRAGRDAPKGSGPLVHGQVADTLEPDAAVGTVLSQRIQPCRSRGHEGNSQSAVGSRCHYRRGDPDDLAERPPTNLIARMLAQLQATVMVDRERRCRQGEPAAGRVPQRQPVVSRTLPGSLLPAVPDGSGRHGEELQPSVLVPPRTGLPGCRSCSGGRPSESHADQGPPGWSCHACHNAPSPPTTATSRRPSTLPAAARSVFVCHSPGLGRPMDTSSGVSGGCWNTLPSNGSPAQNALARARICISPSWSTTAARLDVSGMAPPSPAISGHIRIEDPTCLDSGRGGIGRTMQSRRFCQLSSQ
jgi:hypothetical protein